MAGAAGKHALRLFGKNHGIVLQVLRNRWSPMQITGSRTLFSGDTLGLEGYRRQKGIMEDKMGDLKDKFRERMEEYLNSETKNQVFTNDLKVMAHTASSDEDIGTLIDMIKRYHQQNAEIRFGTFQFGPVIMRLLYSLKQPDIALELFTDPVMDGFFDQMSSFLILMDLLYESTMYNESLEVFELVKDKQLAGFQYPTDCTTLAIASCYKLNSTESFKKAMDILQGAKEKGSMLSQRTISYAALLALKQKQPNVALEVSSLQMERRIGPVTNLNAIAYIDLGRVEDVMPLLRSVAQQDVPAHFQTGNEIFQNTMDKIQAAVDERNDAQLSRQFETLSKALMHGNHISPQDLEEYVCQPIVRRRNDSFKARQRTPPESTFRRAGSSYRRPGLSDID